MEQPVEETEDERPKLSLLNWLNVVSYILNFVFTYGIGVLGLIGNGDNSELSEKYQVGVGEE